MSEHREGLCAVVPVSHIYLGATASDLGSVGEVRALSEHWCQDGKVQHSFSEKNRLTVSWHRPRQLHGEGQREQSHRQLHLFSVVNAPQPHNGSVARKEWSSFPKEKEDHRPVFLVCGLCIMVGGQTQLLSLVSCASATLPSPLCGGRQCKSEFVQESMDKWSLS